MAAAYINSENAVNYTVYWQISTVFVSLNWSNQQPCQEMTLLLSERSNQISGLVRQSLLCPRWLLPFQHYT